MVYPNIYIGNYSTSTNLELLHNVGITHIISVIPTFNPPFPDKFKYLHISAYDDQTQDMLPFFKQSNDFIETVLKDGGKVLIHCMVGRSRSVTVFLAFLISIIRGKFSQSNVNIGANNDVSNEAEYKQFGNFKYVRDRDDDEAISKAEYIKPQLSNKYHNFINYKKETMIHEVEDLIAQYYILQTEYNINSPSVDELQNAGIKVPSLALDLLKQQFANKFIIAILQYIKKYRKTASPNPYFISQLIDLLII